MEWILGKTPDNSQIALFSATLPRPIRKIAQKYLTDPKEIIVQSDKTELETINQQYWMIQGVKKINALIQIFEAVSFDGVIVFTKTKNATLEVAKALENKGFKAEALNGDLAQSARERTVNRLKNKQIDILVATDVAARGLDVDRISHVINYDMPPKVEPYIHRIGRTGRAGRTGEAILFLSRNERWMLKVIERATKQTIKEFRLPSNKDINKKRIADFNHAITQALTSEDLSFFEQLIETYAQDHDIPVTRVAAALAKLNHGSTPFLLPKHQEQNYKDSNHKTKTYKSQVNKIQGPNDRKKIKVKAHLEKSNIIPLKNGMERYRIEVGHRHGVRPGNIVGAIINEAGLEGKYIGNIDINPDFSFVDLPYGMPKQVFQLLEKVRVSSRQMAISKCA